jgi:hypothetical protein
MIDVSIQDAWAWVRKSTFCPFAPGARVWIGPDWRDERAPARNLCAIASELSRFCNVYCEGRYAGFVIEVGANPKLATDIGQAAALFRWLLSELVRLDGRSVSASWADIEERDWQFVFSRTRMFMNLFAPCYPVNHSKHIPFDNRIIVFAQPEESFDFCGVDPSRLSLRKHIRNRFRDGGKPYPGDLIDTRLEAHLYVFPLNHDDPPIRWWEEKS